MNRSLVRGSLAERQPRMYHRRPENLIGSTLYPLALLESLAPDRYQAALASYEDHPDCRGLPMTGVPILSCQWRDVVQCSPIYPHLLYVAQREAGITPRPQRFFAIARDRVCGLSAALFTRVAEGRPAYDLIDWTTYAELEAVPAQTLEWYRRLAERGLRGVTFVGIPHVMVRGPIDIEGCPIVDWSAPE
jgi:hypothetical protein